MKILHALVIIGMLVLAGCTSPGTEDTHVRINGSFIKAGCTQIDDSDDQLNCTSLGLEDRYSCKSIVLSSIAGFHKNDEIAECRSVSESFTAEGIRHEGCMLRQEITYLAAEPVFGNSDEIINWSFHHLNNKDEFASYFGSVQSKEEALAYALAISGESADYAPELPANSRRFVDRLEPTQVNESADGYVVNLFGYQMCGCGPHTHYEITYSVSKRGDVKVLALRNTYENPEQDGLCVD